MSIGALLVIIGVVLAALDAILGYHGTRNGATRSGGGYWLLHIAVILIGIGVLLGGTAVLHLNSGG